MTAFNTKESLDTAALIHLAASWRPVDEAGEHNAGQSRRHRSIGPAQAQQPRSSTEAIDWTENDYEVLADEPVEFADACEEQFARLLDARDLSWLYKPRTFAVEWDAEGNFLDCFTPDFYLPVNGVYVILIGPDRTSSAKIRKVRLLRQQHPDIRIEILASPLDRNGTELRSNLH